MKVKSVNIVITVLIASVVLLTIVTGVWWVSSNTHDTVFAGELEAMENMTGQTMAALDEYLEQSESMSRMIASQQSVINALDGRDVDSAREFFNEMVANTDHFWALFAFDRDGKVIAGFNAKGMDMAGADRSDRDYVRALLDDGKKHYLSDRIFASKSDAQVLVSAASCAVTD